jgi:TM2 domain-containing membrane protein YozV
MTSPPKFCSQCGQALTLGINACSNCGNVIPSELTQPPSPIYPLPNSVPPNSPIYPLQAPTPQNSPINPISTPVPVRNEAVHSKKIAACLFGVCLGFLGAHKFYLGYPIPGIILLSISILTCCVYGFIITAIIGTIEGILYIAKTDEEFEQTYITNRRPWF